MKVTDVAWAAGLYEGEGSIHVTGSGPVLMRPNGKRKAKYSAPRVQIKMTDRDVLERFHRVVGVGSLAGPYDNGPLCKPVYQWSISGFPGSQYVIALFWQWLGERRKQRAREVLLETRVKNIRRVA